MSIKFEVNLLPAPSSWARFDALNARRTNPDRSMLRTFPKVSDLESVEEKKIGL